MINMFLNIPFKPTDYNTELNTIKYIVQENYYNPQLISTLIRSTKQKKLKTEHKTKQQSSNQKNKCIQCHIFFIDQ